MPLTFSLVHILRESDFETGHFVIFYSSWQQISYNLRSMQILIQTLNSTKKKDDLRVYHPEEEVSKKQ